MTQIADQRSIVGVDPGSRGLAFVFFERGTLLDWGTRRRDGDELALLDRLLDRCNAEVLVLKILTLRARNGGRASAVCCGSWPGTLRSAA